MITTGMMTGFLGLGYLSRINVHSSYAAGHPAVPGFDAVATTLGYTVVFLVSSLDFAAGGLLAAALFPSKARLAATRESVSPTSLHPTEAVTIGAAGAVEV